MLQDPDCKIQANFAGVRGSIVFINWPHPESYRNNSKLASLTAYCKNMSALYSEKCFSMCANFTHRVNVFAVIFGLFPEQLEPMVVIGSVGGVLLNHFV
jgi:hypothetical protein